ncbi:hypothetical protein H7F15_09790 [Pontibacter sp. Tf4]|uniref:hypothetical protein n=1 Tax=Pontibacter sp. Tf4 TaxID=2761620 RepID=UPI00162A93E8|nr:hypothetical protein [Pontibacter sp. Tf4]MBB6611328.1 hypothetical protein [Pontibacter sp. Tf4]
MRNLLVAGMIAVLLSACGSAEEQKTKPTEIAEAETNIIKQSVKYHTFSDPATKDIFIVQLRGDSVQAATVTFEIKNSKGEQIYEEKFKAIDLINYDLPENASPEEWDKFILNRIDSFFDEKNFATPAIKEGMTFDPYYADSTAWNDIKNDSSRVGFYYLLGKEDGRWIAYSEALQKVVMYFNCC